MEPLFTVDSVIRVVGRGPCVVGLPFSKLDLLAPGDPVVLRRPDGTTLSSFVVGIVTRQSFRDSPPPIENRLFPVALADDLEHEEIPEGTHVCLTGGSQPQLRPDNS